MNQYCDMRLYNLEALKLHIKKEHYQCDICRNQHPYMVYKDYPMLKKHFDASHFPCTEPECLEMRVVVFGTQNELEYHKDKTHRKGGNKGKFDAGNLLGVRFEEDDDDDDDGYYLNRDSTNQRGGRGGRGGSSMNTRGLKGIGPELIGKDFANIVKLELL